MGEQGEKDSGDGAGMVPVPLAVLQPGTAAPVDLYLPAQGGRPHLLYKKSGAPLPEEIRTRLLEHGIDRLYLRDSDGGAYEAYVERHIAKIIEEDMMPHEESSKLVYRCASRVMDSVFENPRSGRQLKRARNLVEATVTSVLKDPESLWHMASIAGHDYYTYTHCVNVGMFMTAASHDIFGVKDRTMLQAIGLGGMLHDIGKSEIPESILSKPGKLTDEEFATIKKHPVMGLSLVRRMPQLLGVTTDIVRYHHERYDGSGYPTGRRGEGLDRLVRLSTVVDVYDALTTNRPYAQARQPYAALELMIHRMGGHFDVGVLESFVRFLGPRDARQQMRKQWQAAMREAVAAQ